MNTDELIPLNDTIEPRKLSNKVCPDDMTLEDWQATLRRENARDAGYQVKHLDENRIWGDYMVDSGTGQYRVAFRGVRSGRNFCSCLDFRTNGLGTCKHLEAVTLYLAQEVGGYPWGNLSLSAPYTSIYVSYKGERSVHIRVGNTAHAEFLRLKDEYFTEDGILPVENYNKLQDICQRGLHIDSSFRCYDDVYDFTKQVLQKHDWQLSIAANYPNEKVDNHFAEKLPEVLQQKIYKMLKRGYGMLPNVSDEVAMSEVLALAEAILLRSQSNAQGYIILDNKADLMVWQQFVQKVGLSSLPIKLSTAKAFAQVATDFNSSTAFIYIDRADNLREWRNPLSLMLKRIPFDHLYLRINTLSNLTPVQLSSILQHITPYILGPFYRFIHTYRPGFPLLDNGSNLPRIMEDYIFIHHEEERDSLKETAIAELMEPLSHKGMTADDKIRHFFGSLTLLLEDTEAMARMKKLIEERLLR